MTKKNKIIIKSTEDQKKMAEGGKKLAKIKKKLVEKIKIGTNAQEIDKLAEEMISKAGGDSSFKMVPNYHWTTCININDGVVHGIPKKEIVFTSGDIISVDVGMFYKGFHTDTSFSVALEAEEEVQKFLEDGKKAMMAGIKMASPGKRIFDISEAIEISLAQNELTPVWSLVGHGVGKKLHEAPQIPCYASGKRKLSPVIEAGMVFAIEVMYTKGDGKVVLEDDGWTISTHDGTISALWEETVLVAEKGPKIITKIKK